MYRFPTALALALLISASTGCHGPGGSWLDGLHYPFSCPRCPYFDYQNGKWQPFRFGVVTVTDDGALPGTAEEAHDLPSPAERSPQRRSPTELPAQRPLPTARPAKLPLRAERHDMPPGGARGPTESLWDTYTP